MSRNTQINYSGHILKFLIALFLSSSLYTASPTVITPQTIAETTKEIKLHKATIYLMKGKEDSVKTAYLVISILKADAGSIKVKAKGADPVKYSIEVDGTPYTIGLIKLEKNEDLEKYKELLDSISKASDDDFKKELDTFIKHIQDKKHELTFKRPKISYKAIEAKTGSPIITFEELDPKVELDEFKFRLQLAFLLTSVDLFKGNINSLLQAESDNYGFAGPGNMKADLTLESDDRITQFKTEIEKIGKEVDNENTEKDEKEWYQKWWGILIIVVWILAMIGVVVAIFYFLNFNKDSNKI